MRSPKLHYRVSDFLVINGIKTSRKNEITWEVSGRILGAGVILLQNLQQQRRESTLLCCCRIGCVFPEHSVSKPLRRRELDCVIGGKGECFTCLWVASFSGGPCHRYERPETGEKTPFPFRQRFRECVDLGLNELFHFGFC